MIILIDCGIALKEVPLTLDSEAVSIVAHESVDRRSNAIPVHSITAGTAKLPDWQIMEAEGTLGNNIRGPTRRAIGDGDPMRRVNFQIRLYPPHENRKIERRLRGRHHKIS